ncbi:MAG TPA: TonB-dependent receptor [Acidobacteriota bacterium]|nr:TonB-dependent receptor [Acidobacteriota bacterium]
MKCFCCISLFLVVLTPGFSQPTSLRGQVTDTSGAVIPGAKIVLNGPSASVKTTTTDASGQYVFTDLPLGDYTVQASAPSLALPQPVPITLMAGENTLNLQLKVLLEEKVTVEESATRVNTESSNNASAVVLRGDDLNALADNPEDLQADLQALAGPAAGPGGNAILVDGFSGADLPPKDTIREIRINQNPFSPEYDKIGFGRIEIFTKPGTDKFHGSIGYNFANDWWNSRNAYAAEKAPFRLNELRNTFSGSLSKRTSFNLNLVREWVDNGNVVNGVILDPQTLVAAPFTGTPVSGLRRTGFTPRIDYRLGAKHTLSVRYSYNRDIVRNAGAGSLNLVSRGYHNNSLGQTVQVTETAVLGTKAINEIRFQFYRPETISLANTLGYALQVLGAFNGGGNPLGRSTNTQNNYEVQNYTSILHLAHSWRFGIRLRQTSETSVSPQNYLGMFTFGGGLAPQLDADNQPVIDAAGQAVLVNISSIESYRRTLLFQRLGFPAAQIRQLGGGAAQFTINAGNPLITGSQFDLGAFVGDDWKAKRNLTLNFGLRYETQTNIHDWRDFAPRVGLAWAPGSGTGKSQPRSVIRAGFGMFYDRFSLGNILTAQRYNGLVQQQYVLANPDFFPVVPPISSLPGPVPPSTIQRISPTLRAPYLMQSAVGFERQMPFNTTVALTYASTHGLHMLRSQDINAPLPGTYVPSVPGSGVYPLGRPGLVVLMESSGLYNQNQLILNVNTRVNRNLSLSGSYTYSRAMSNTDGLGTFPASPYSMAGEYAPAAMDIHHLVMLSGTITPKWGIQFNPLLTANTGPPFDITAGQDLYGDTLFNARPGIATSPNKPGVIATKYGPLDPSPTPDQKLLSRNFGRGPGQIMLNMRVGKTFAFGATREGTAAASGGGPGGGGPGGGGPGAGRYGAPQSPFSMGGGGGPGASTSTNRRYNLTISMQIRNLTNHNNPGPIIGNITSPLFSQANQPAGVGGIFSESANNRRLELQMRLTF